jgi:hypothetical protein
MINMEKFKIGTKIKMYGCGDGNSTFWDGDKATVVGYDKWDRLICKPTDWPEERHHMHPKQCRKLIKKGKSKKPLKRKLKNPRTGSKCEDFFASLQ